MHVSGLRRQTHSNDSCTEHSDAPWCRLQGCRQVQVASCAIGQQVSRRQVACIQVGVAQVKRSRAVCQALHQCAMFGCCFGAIWLKILLRACLLAPCKNSAWFLICKLVSHKIQNVYTHICLHILSILVTVLFFLVAVLFIHVKTKLLSPFRGSSRSSVPVLQASTPQASTPQARTPQASTPQASTSQASTSQASTSQASTSCASTRKYRFPQVITPFFCSLLALKTGCRGSNRRAVTILGSRPKAGAQRTEER